MMIHKGMKLKVDFNPHLWGDGLPDIQEVFVTSDDAPRELSSCSFIVVGRTMKEWHTISTNQVVKDNYQPALF